MCGMRRWLIRKDGFTYGPSRVCIRSGGRIRLREGVITARRTGAISGRTREFGFISTTE